MKKALITSFIACIFFISCKKEDTDAAKPVAVKCSKATILDDLLSGKQMYVITRVATVDVLLNLKDKKGKARAFSRNVLYEWDLAISTVSDTKVKLQAGDIRGIQGNFEPGLYLPDSFIFLDDNCKISGETFDGQLENNKPINFEDITSSKDLATILEKYYW